ncbi:MAG: aminotransferase class I/II-fold pyridoxal phosphate-dependent enzyme, partial [Bacteroidales bacterium]|nr:aminotransferase class I/II-fold pyridoxal phosphate-dependent enzyme [Bacteroidales bacterium]
MIITPAQRTLSVKPYYFSVKNPEIAALSAERVARGEDPVINLGIGSPDRMPPQEAIDELCRTAQLPDSHKYQNYRGLPELRKAFAQWYERYYGVTIDPETEIQPLMGSKEGILLISLAFVNPGDKVLVPDPGYPTYTSASRLVDAEILTYDLKEENGWMPDYQALEKMDLEGVKLMWTNYPNMPTGTPAAPDTYHR